MTREILAIDHDKLPRWSLSKLLDWLGYRMRGSPSAEEELAKAGESRPDLPVLVMGANATPETVRRMRRLGACAFLAKPYAAVLLLALVASLL